MCVAVFLIEKDTVHDGPLWH